MKSTTTFVEEFRSTDVKSIVFVFSVKCFGICGWAVLAGMVKFELLWDEKKTIILQKLYRTR